MVATIIIEQLGIPIDSRRLSPASLSPTSPLVQQRKRVRSIALAPAERLDGVQLCTVNGFFVSLNLSISDCQIVSSTIDVETHVVLAVGGEMTHGEIIMIRKTSAHIVAPQSCEVNTFRCEDLQTLGKRVTLFEWSIDGLERWWV